MILVFVERGHTPQNGKRRLGTEAPEFELGPAGASRWIVQCAWDGVSPKGLGGKTRFSFHPLNRTLPRGDQVEPAMRIPVSILWEWHMPIRPLPCS